MQRRKISNNAPEYGNRLKNGTSPKSLMSKENFFNLVKGVNVKRKILIIYFFSALYGAVFVGCNKDNNSESDAVNPYDEKGLLLINKVSKQCENYIESYLQQYFSQSTDANINDLVNKINNIDEVKEASPNDDNSVVRVKLKNGACFNHIIFRRDDERLTTEEIEKIIQQFLNVTDKSAKSNLKSNYNTPNRKAAVILAPFQSEWIENLSGIVTHLTNAGYAVTPPVIDQNVSIVHFFGDFLKYYGVIFISTHGASQLQTLSGDSSKMMFLSTSITINNINVSSYSVEDRKNLAILIPDNGQMYLAVSEKLISKNLNPLPNSLVYIDACESAKLSSIFLDNGAGAYVGWNGSPSSSVSFPIVELVFDNLSKGIEFDEVFSCYNFPSIYRHYKKDPKLPYYLKINASQVSTNACKESDITETTAIVSGNVIDAGVPPYTEKGICWSTHSNPTVNDNKKTVNGNNGQLGSYSCTLTGLTQSTPYYAKAYVIQNDTTVYGNEISFKTQEYSLSGVWEALIHCPDYVNHGDLEFINATVFIEYGIDENHGNSEWVNSSSRFSCFPVIKWELNEKNITFRTNGDPFYDSYLYLELSGNINDTYDYISGDFTDVWGIEEWDSEDNMTYYTLPFYGTFTMHKVSSTKSKINMRSNLIINRKMNNRSNIFRLDGN